MSRWLNLTRLSDQKIAVNTDHIAWIAPCAESPDSCEIYRADSTQFTPLLVVKESYEQVLEMLV
jgi:hypothetical protein